VIRNAFKRPKSHFYVYKSTYYKNTWHKCIKIKSPSTEISVGKCSPKSGLPDFSWYNVPKRGDGDAPNDHKLYQIGITYMYQMAVEYFQCPSNIRNVSEIFQMIVKYSKC
jgi:hypothetical protein